MKVDLRLCLAVTGTALIRSTIWATTPPSGRLPRTMHLTLGTATCAILLPMCTVMTTISPTVSLSGVLRINYAKASAFAKAMADKSTDKKASRPSRPMVRDRSLILPRKKKNALKREKY